MRFMTFPYAPSQSAPFRVSTLVVEAAGRYLGLLLWAVFTARSRQLSVEPQWADALAALARNTVRQTGVVGKFHTGSVLIQAEVELFGGGPSPKPVAFEVVEKYRVDQGVEPGTRPSFTFLVEKVVFDRDGVEASLTADEIDAALAAVMEGRDLEATVVQQLRLMFE